MNYKMMGRFCAQILALETIFMIPPLLISIYKGESDAIKGFLCTMVLTATLTVGMLSICRGARPVFFAREGMICAGLSWILMILTGSLPFYISGDIPLFIDALFETTSGFTTTGATILSDIESLSMGILFWRNFTNWIGGMGVLVFLLAIAPYGKGDGFTMHLMRAESPGPSFGKLVPKLKQTAGIMYLIYVGMTLIDIGFLLAGGMSVFDAVTTSFSTAGTGGFMVKNDSVAGYSPYIQYVCTVFMLLFAVNFTCFYMLLVRQFKSVLKYEELRLYVGIVAASIMICTLNQLYYGGPGTSVEETFRGSAFSVASIITSTGFSTVDYDLWPSMSKGVLLCISMIGGCAGSTCGGLKCMRFLIIFKAMRRNIRQVLNPQRIQVVKIDGKAIDEKIVNNTYGFLAAYLIIIFTSFIVVSFDNYTMGTNFSAVIACVNNIGPGFDAVGPMYNFGGFNWVSKLIFCFDMLAGRLEIFPILILFSRSTWKHK